jgi:hypothetical protein
MRQVLARWVPGAALLLAVLVGCNHTPLIPRNDRAPAPTAESLPEVPALVRYLNKNADLVQAVESSSLHIDCSQGSQKVGLDGLMACQKPRNFRLTAKMFAQPAADIGSNNDEFWYWISKADPPYVYHCSYRDLGTGRVRVPFPFQPDMVVAALGMAKYDENAKYELKAPPKAKYVELVQNTTSPQGQPVQRITVFHRYEQKAPEPQVLAHVLKDARGKLICQATVHKVQIDRVTRATLPTKVTLEWPDQKLRMTLIMPDLHGVNLTPDRTALLFRRDALNKLTAYDLARQGIDRPSSIQRAGATLMAPTPR